MSEYISLLSPRIQNPHSHDYVSESPNNYYCLTERHIQAMWLEQKYFKHLTTIENTPIRVLSPGIWNTEAGPDFLKAHLQIGEQEYHGDIELHLVEDSWYHHKHHLDKNYDNVVLHVSFWKSVKVRPILTSEGKHLPRAQLERHLTISETRIVKLIDLDLYPYQHFSGTGHCSNHLFNTLPINKTNEFFQSAANWRLEQKWILLQEKSSNLLPIASGIATALGYKHNSEAFLELFFQLKSENNKDEHSLFAYALGCCGFFEPYYHEKWGKSSYYQLLAENFSKESNEKKALTPLRLDKIRPANHPVRRLAILVKLCIDPTITGLTDQIIVQWQSNWQLNTKNKWKSMRSGILELLPNYCDAYWERHYTFEVTPQPKAIDLMGGNLKSEILINICIPLLYANIKKRNDPHELMAFQQFFNSLSATKSRKSTYLIFRFFGNHPNKQLISQATFQQGALQLHRDFCIHFEASCIGCPLVDRYKKNKG